MVEWINIGVLVLSTVLFLYFYVKSVGPAALEKKIGDGAYSKCKKYRQIAGMFEGITILNYIVYRFYPLPIGFPDVLPWDYIISVPVGLVILILGLFIMGVGVKDAGREALEPRKEHTLYRGIYDRVRHPQAIGEAPLWFPFALFLNSPFLLLYSFVWIPIFYIMCIAEERDLIIRYGQPYLEYRDRVGFLIPKRKKSGQLDK
ncbi:MAG: isoprenylcysteine carboxylmethyltransferase family protein [Candidatus Thorarchaeota archaeon]